MEPTDAAEQIQEAAEAAHAAQERFRARAALQIAVLAMLLAITSLAGGNVTEDILNNNIQASDTWAFYQAKNIRQTANELAADALQAELRLHPGAPGDARHWLQERIAAYRARAARYESEPSTGEGKKELMERARRYEAARDRALRQDPNFDYAEALFQIAIVLGSVAILSLSRPVLILSLALGGVACALMVNGFLLLFPLPF